MLDDERVSGIAIPFPPRKVNTENGRHRSQDKKNDPRPKDKRDQHSHRRGKTISRQSDRVQYLQNTRYEQERACTSKESQEYLFHMISLQNLSVS